MNLPNMLKAKKRSNKKVDIVYDDYNNGDIVTFDTQQELATLLKVSKPTVRYWLQNKNQGYLKHNINKIEYIKI